jgi:hypothetical protein
LNTRRNGDPGVDSHVSIAREQLARIAAGDRRPRLIELHERCLREMKALGCFRSQ